MEDKQKTQPNKYGEIRPDCNLDQNPYTYIISNPGAFIFNAMSLELIKTI
jgi:hypothetical protein